MTKYDSEVTKNFARLVCVCDCLHLYLKTAAGHLNWLRRIAQTYYIMILSHHLFMKPQISLQSSVKCSRNIWRTHTPASTDIPCLISNLAQCCSSHRSHYSHYLYPIIEWQFISNVSLYLDNARHTHPPDWLLCETGTLFRKSLHIHVPDWLYCVGEWSL